MIQAAIKDLGLLARKRRIVFIVLIASVTCSFLVISLMTGVVRDIIRSAGMGSMWNTFTIEVPEGIGAEDLTEKYELLMRESSPTTVFAVSLDDSGSTVVGWYGDNKNRWFTQDEGRFLTDSDVKSTARVAVVSWRLYPAFGFEEGACSVSVGGTDADIIGVCDMVGPHMLFMGVNEVFDRYNNGVSDTVILPITTFAELGLTARLIRVEYSVGSEKIMAQYHAFLESVFPGAGITDPVIAETYFSDSMKEAVIRSAGLILLAFINIAALYVYWLLMMRRTHTIYMVCGASRSAVIRMILLEWFLITLLGYILYVVIQHSSMPVLDFMNIEPIRSAGVQALCFAFIYLLSTGLMIRQVVRNARIHAEVI